ncbi:MAG: hypothetical protein R3C56_37055 [Pirellulaceae bacterium]
MSELLTQLAGLAVFQVTLAHLIERFHAETGTNPDEETTEEFTTHQKRLKDFSQQSLCSGPPSILRWSGVCQMNVVMACNQMAKHFSA